MNFPKLKVRPRSTHTVYRFGGLWHSGEAPVGMNQSTVMRWEDLRGLGPDKSPMLSTALTGSAAVSIDGNTINQPLIGAADGEHPVFLDEMGTLWCNGETLPMFFGAGPSNIYDPDEESFWTVLARAGKAGTTLAITDEDKIWAKLSFDKTHRKTFTLEAVDPTHVVCEGYVNTFADLGLQVSPLPSVGDLFYIDFLPYFANSYVPLVRMGAYVICSKFERRFCNVEFLAASLPMTEGEDYGSTDASQLTDLSDTNVHLTLCQMDGTPYTAVPQTTPPSSHTNVWIDTSGPTAVAMEWSESYSAWVAIPTTYVKIYNIHVAAASGSDYGALKAGDGVQIKTYNTNDNNIDPYVKSILNSSHVLVDAVITNANTGVGYVIVAGTLQRDEEYVTSGDADSISIVRAMPGMDYMVEANNRLWGCAYYVDDLNGTMINEIYASKLGDFRNWEVYEGLSTDSWRASRGTPAPFTGAAVLSGHPLFFREESVEKVYPSSSGAHQIQTYSIDGVLLGADRSLVVIDEMLYYQSRLGICVYDGTMPRRIAQAFGDLQYAAGIAGRHKKRYEISMVPLGGGARTVGVYDIASGEWFIENNGWDLLAFCWKDELYTSSNSGLYIQKRHTNITTGAWYAESGIIGYELPEHRFISCIRIRMRSQLNHPPRTVVLKIMYDDSGTWETKGTYTLSSATNSQEANIFPRRCDHFRLRLEGTGGADILSMSFRMERSEGGH